MTAAASSPLVAAAWTTPPGGAHWIALYDGHCVFCTKQARQFQRLVGAGRVKVVSFQDEGALDRFPGVTHTACMERIHVVRPDGRVFAGAEAVARAVARVPVIGWLAFAYYVPGLRQLTEWGYGVVARYRYRIAGRDCDGGTCSLHR